MTTFGELCCEVCREKPQVLHRANAKGEKGRWRCEGCLDVPPPEDVLGVTDAIVVANHEANLSGGISAEEGLHRAGIRAVSDQGGTE